MIELLDDVGDRRDCIVDLHRLMHTDHITGNLEMNNLKMYINMHFTKVCLYITTKIHLNGGDDWTNHMEI